MSRARWVQQDGKNKSEKFSEFSMDKRKKMKEVRWGNSNVEPTTKKQ